MSTTEKAVEGGAGIGGLGGGDGGSIGDDDGHGAGGVGAGGGAGICPSAGGLKFCSVAAAFMVADNKSGHSCLHSVPSQNIITMHVDPQQIPRLYVSDVAVIHVQLL